MPELRTSFQTFDVAMEREIAKLEWMQAINLRRAQLEAIADITILDTLWESGLEDGGVPELRLAYRGKGHSQAEAREGLICIMEALRVRNFRLRMWGGWNSPYRAWYEGNGELGDIPVKVRLSVPWLKPGCHVKVERRTYHRQYDTHYTMVCGR